MNDSVDLDTLVQQLDRYNAAYRQGAPLVSDAQYDDLVEALRSLAPDHPFLQAVEPETFEGKKKVRHPDPMLSTEKAYTQEELNRFVLRVEKAAAQLGRKSVQFRVTAKLDGLAGRDDGTILASRGDGRWGYDITGAFDKGVVPVGGRGGGLGEIVIVKSYFDAHLSSVFEHPRNLVVGIVTSDQVNAQAQGALEDGAVHFVAYGAMDGLICSGRELVDDMDGITRRVLENIDYPVDGLVAEVVDPDLRTAMGRTAHHYRWQIAVKTRGETAETRVLDLTWQVGRTGNITPVMEVSPVSLSGATIRRVTAHNAGMIERLGIGPGAEIEIIRSGEVIPKLEQVLAPADTVALPRTCPSCETALVRQNDFLRCPNTEGCRDQSVQRIRYWFHTLGNADWFGQKTVEKLVDAGHRRLEAIYGLNAGDYEALGFGPVQSKNLEEAVRLSRTQPVEDWRFLAAFGVSDLGLGDSRNLLRVFPLESLLAAEADQIARIRGFGQRTSVSIAEGLAMIGETIRHMLRLDFSLQRTPPRLEAFLLALGLFEGIEGLEGLRRKDKQEKMETLAHTMAGRIGPKALAVGDEAAVLEACGDDRVICTLIMASVRRLARPLKQAADLDLEWIRPEFGAESSRTTTLAGLKIVFTGKMESGSREEMTRKAEALGAIVQKAVSGNTDLLVCGEKVGAKKLEKARAAGVRLLSEAEYRQMVETDGAQ